MINKGMTLLRSELADYIESRGGDPTEVRLGNVSLLESDNAADLQEKIIISLVNIEEERTMKNGLTYRKIGTETQYINPPVNLNLYVLFSANYRQGSTPYENALQRLSQIIAFFQGKPVFTLSNSPNSPISVSADPNLADLKLILDLHTLTFEQINHLWGSLGGKQIPFVMYKVRLVKIERDSTRATSPVIENVKGDTEAF